MDRYASIVTQITFNADTSQLRKILASLAQSSINANAITRFGNIVKMVPSDVSEAINIISSFGVTPSMQKVYKVYTVDQPGAILSVLDLFPGRSIASMYTDGDLDQIVEFT